MSLSVVKEQMLLCNIFSVSSSADCNTVFDVKKPCSKRPLDVSVPYYVNKTLITKGFICLQEMSVTFWDSNLSVSGIWPSPYCKAIRLQLT